MPSCQRYKLSLFYSCFGDDVQGCCDANVVVLPVLEETQYLSQSALYSYDVGCCFLKQSCANPFSVFSRIPQQISEFKQMPSLMLETSRSMD